MKIRTKFSILLVISAVLSLLTFSFLWKNMGNVWKFMCRFPAISWDKQALIEKMEETAPYYDVPDSEKDIEGTKAFKPFFDIKDEYTSLYIYEIGGKGLYRAGSYSEIMATSPFSGLMSLEYQLTSGEVEMHDEVPIEFHNGEYSVMIFSYHSVKIVSTYLIISVLLSLAVFLSINLVFINRKMKAVLSIKDEILLMASGELEHPVPGLGEDEIGILSRELDYMRITLKENIRQEEESRKANQDLITAMSHDLRTPLTILSGYLEVLRHKRIPMEMEDDYLDRCLQKTMDIKEMTDKMFEYALVYEETEDVNITKVSLAAIREILNENLDFLRLAGFQADITMEECAGAILGDETLLKRIFNNLFSNILKYGDKINPVKLSLQMEKKKVKISLFNTVKKDKEGIESNCIGLKSAEKMVELLEGEIYVLNETGVYSVQIILPMG